MGGAARWFDEQFALLLLLFRPAGPFELLGEKRNGEARGGMASRLKAAQNSAQPLTSCGRSGVGGCWWREVLMC